MVLASPGDGYCALLDRAYDSYQSADGARCGGDGAGYCIAGDRCQADGICVAVLSAARGAPHAALLGRQYDSFSSADGAPCGGEGLGYCIAGDRCVSAGVCELVLTGLGGTVRADLVGTTYGAFDAADGIDCGGEGAGHCIAGDRCVAAGQCEVVLSAWSPPG